MSEDLISRQEALYAVNKAFDRETLLTGLVRSIAVRAIRYVPSAELTEQVRTYVSLADCVSKQAAIHAAIEAVDEWDGGYNLARADKIISAIKKLPSVEPEIIRCQNCKYYDDRPCGIVDYYNTESDFCSRAERRTDE